MLERRPLGGWVLEATAARGRIMALLGRYTAVAPVRLAVIDARGEARTVAVPGIRGG